MGGPGSGQWYRWDRRSTLDELTRLDVRWLHRHGYLDGWPHWMSWSLWRGETGSAWVGLVDNCLVVTYRAGPRGKEDGDAVPQTIALDWTSCYYGGRRPWFLCPGCQRRVAVVYAIRQWLWIGLQCRHCVRLPYASQCETPRDRLLRKRLKLRARFGGQSTKPKGMHWRTWERFLAQDIRVRLAMYVALGVL